MSRRCPLCGTAGIFAGYAELRQRCPGCGHKFEREPGFWVGAMIIITTITFALFILLLVGGMVLTWPDVPWTTLLVVTLVANLIAPILLYGTARLVWAALELSWHPLEPDEAEEAAEHVARN